MVKGGFIMVKYHSFDFNDFLLGKNYIIYDNK